MTTKDIKIDNVGTLTVTGPLFAAEGCGPNDGVTIENTLSGVWGVKAHMFGYRPLDIIATHSAFEGQDLEFVQALMPNGEPADIGVDRGKAGFFDLKSLPAKPKSQSYFGKEWRDYSEAFDETGLTVMSGYGDGGYPLYVARDSEGRVVAAKLVFITKPGGCETPGCDNTTDDTSTCEACLYVDENDLTDYQKETLERIRQSSYWLRGHFSLAKEPEPSGSMVMETLRTLAPKDAWHAKHGIDAGFNANPVSAKAMGPNVIAVSHGDTFKHPSEALIVLKGDYYHSEENTELPSLSAKGFEDALKALSPKDAWHQNGAK